MNLSNVIDFTDDSITTVKVRYQRQPSQAKITAQRKIERSTVGETEDGTPYLLFTYKAKLEVASSLHPGDTVVVEGATTPFNLAIIVSVDTVADIDVEADYTYKWVISRVDTSIAEWLKDEDEAKLKELTALQRSSMRARLKKLLETGLTIEGTI